MSSNSLKMIFLMCVNIAFNRLFKLSFITLLTMNIIAVFTIGVSEKVHLIFQFLLLQLGATSFPTHSLGFVFMCDLFEKFPLIFSFTLPSNLSARRSAIFSLN